MVKLYADRKLNVLAHFLFYFLVSSAAFGFIVVCIQFFGAVSAYLGGGPFDIEPDDGWLYTAVLVSGISFLIAAVHALAGLQDSRQEKE